MPSVRGNHGSGQHYAAVLSRLPLTPLLSMSPAAQLLLSMASPIVPRFCRGRAADSNRPLRGSAFPSRKWPRRPSTNSRRYYPRTTRCGAVTGTRTSPAAGGRFRQHCDAGPDRSSGNLAGHAGGDGRAAASTRGRPVHNRPHRSAAQVEDSPRQSESRPKGSPTTTRM